MDGEDPFRASNADNFAFLQENQSGSINENPHGMQEETYASSPGYVHIPVLICEVLNGLNIRPDGIYVDGTAGGGGHSLAIAKKLGSNGRLICIDRDMEAVSACQKRLAPYSDKVSVIQGNFRDTVSILRAFGVSLIDGMVLDLGVSSHQFDDPRRGFSYRYDGPLDMRMDQTSPFSAYDVVNSYSEDMLFHIIHDNGEEHFAGSIARKIVEARKEKPIETTFELVDIIKAAIPAKMRRKKHPARKTFQALRIEVNGELIVLADALDEIIDILKPGGRLAVISFHSLEHRIIKQVFKNYENTARDFEEASFDKELLSGSSGDKPKGRMISKKAIKASDEERMKNPRAKSAMLRIFERIG